MKYLITYLLLAGGFMSFAQSEDPRRTYQTASIDGEVPVIDGRLDDPAWEQVEWAGDFIQRQPVDGAAPSQQTQFKILYDAKYLYIGIRAFDTEPDKVVRRMSRRDGFEGDFVEVNIDSYADKRTAFSFSASASGVKGEEYISNNGENWDATWDPIWYLKTSLDEFGWIAEFKIPLSQLRFADKESHVWGIQVMRMLFREQERSYWQPIEQGAPGWVHLFGEMHGIRGIKPQKQLEIQPYVLAKTEFSEEEEGNPYATGRSSDIDLGVDAKIGLTSDITLDLTINPDFGQVEADPSRVNLSAFQLFFQERRPFFLEGNNILNFRLTESVAGGPFNNDNLFYSRRIGGKPSYYPEDGDIAYVDQIENTRILGAAKLTGKNKNGFSWGVLESVTNKEKVEITDTLGDSRMETVEPLTNYLVGRVQQDINQGNALIGAMVTATNRNLDEDRFDYLHDDAYSGGIDFTQNFNDRNYYVTLNGVFSHVTGSPYSIYQTQTSSERFFQRPDNRRSQVDSTRTSLTGTSASAALGKRSGNIIFQTGATMRSPEFELNDVGFLVQSDYISQWTWAQYRILKPFGIFRWFRLNGNQYLTWDFDGVNIYQALNFNMHMQFENLWFLGMGSSIYGKNVSNADLRGGPSIRYPGGNEYWLYLSSNDNKKFYMDMNPWIAYGSHDNFIGKGIDIGIRYQPTDALRLSVSPGISTNDDELQYVDSYESGGNGEYILGNIKQVTYSASVRVNYIITPNLSIEYWGQPFISSGEYSNFKRVLDPNANEYNQRYLPYDANQIMFMEDELVYHIDHDRNGEVDYVLDDPNFNFMQFRSNCVLRWEYIPGSTLFLVWTSNASEYHNSRRNSFSELTNDLNKVNGSNIFLLKYTYRFIL
ncbi:carbohydrate binding family 9 domain-containing protein [Marinoscillum pacificum]|uniref:carbohydrate binding family 9 domain-containing protein n=1 Tax=Marinoscillum pacificum TaxID=392723 RepID=UPI00215833B1|nr:carbohydrate binding family 9 domain-containing protein [Marinoscillum pacificum]